MTRRCECLGREGPPALCRQMLTVPAGLTWGGCKWSEGVSLASLPGQPGHLPSCPRTESGPAFIFSFFSGLPFGPSRLFLFESLFLPLGLLPDRSAPGRERESRWLSQTASARATIPACHPGIPPHHLGASTIQVCTPGSEPWTTEAPVRSGTGGVGECDNCQWGSGGVWGGHRALKWGEDHRAASGWQPDRQGLQVLGESWCAEGWLGVRGQGRAWNARPRSWT